MKSRTKQNCQRKFRHSFWQPRFHLSLTNPFWDLLCLQPTPNICFLYLFIYIFKLILPRSLHCAFNLPLQYCHARQITFHRGSFVWAQPGSFCARIPRVLTRRVTHCLVIFYPLIIHNFKPLAINLLPLISKSLSLYIFSFLLVSFSLPFTFICGCYSWRLKKGYSDDTSKHGHYHCFFREVSSELFAESSSE